MNGWHYENASLSSVDDVDTFRAYDYGKHLSSKPARASPSFGTYEPSRQMCNRSLYESQGKDNMDSYCRWSGSEGRQALKPPPPAVPEAIRYHGSPENHRKTIEVAPGLKLPLCASDETRQAVWKGHLAATQCFSCDQRIYSVEYAAYVLCPGCLTVWPLEAPLEGASCVGLGLTEADRIDVMSRA